jgi:prophage maintenance system killer protein
MPASIAYLRADEIEELHGTRSGDPAKLAEIERAQAAVAASDSNATVRDVAASYIQVVVHVRAFPDGNRRVAHRGTYRICGRNGWQVLDGDELADVVSDADERNLSAPAIRDRLERITEPLW